LEAVFSRGDRKLTPVLLNAWENGARFDSWSDCFNFSLWHTAFAAHGLDIKDYLQSIDKEAALPWDHIDTGINKSYLLKEWDCSRKAEPTPKCRDRNCSKCKGCSYPAYDNRKTATVIDAKTEWPSIGKKDAPHIHRYRVRYAKTGIGRYFSHIETSTILQRSLRRAGVKAIYSRGYHPKMQLSFPPALALGMEGKQELFEFRSHFLLPDNAEESINKYLPEGIQLSAVNDIKYDAPSLTKSIQHLVYSLNLEAEPIRKSLEARAGGNLDSFMKIFVDYDKESGPGALQKIKLNSEENSLIMVYSFHPGISIRPQSILEEEFTINQPSFYLTREDIRLF
jgi:radical SAM-linked protein